MTKTQGQLQSGLFLADKSWLTSRLLDSCTQAKLVGFVLDPDEHDGAWVQPVAAFTTRHQVKSRKLASLKKGQQQEIKDFDFLQG